MKNDQISFKSGYISLVGRPNVGKSTLINTLLDQKIAAVSPRAQTTRRRQLGIISTDQYQVILMDNPGFHYSHHKLGEFMNEVALASLTDADIILWIVDASQVPDKEDLLAAQNLLNCSRLPPVFLLLNKMDLLKGDEKEARQNEFQALFPSAKPVWISAVSSDCRQIIFDTIVPLLPDGVPYYDPDQVTDLYERDIAADLIRESALIYLRDEIPHSIAVRVDEFIEKSESGAHITATIIVERDSHKGIVIGKAGEMIKKIGTHARLEIEKMSARKIYLELRVKVNKNWRDNPDYLHQIGYFLEKDS